MTHTKEEVFSKVQTALVDALGVDAEEVTPDATLVGDLGAESIDFLDIVFRLEKSFGIEIPRAELFPEDVFTNTDYVQNGKVTAKGFEELRRRLPFAADHLGDFEKDPKVQNFANLITVQVLCNYVEGKLAKAA